MKHFIIIFLAVLIIPFKLIGQKDLQNKIEVYIKLAEENYSKENYDQAMINLDSASALDPDNGEIYRIRGMIYYEQSESRRAINEFNNAIRFDPGNPETYFYRSLVRFEVGDHRNYSLNDINMAIELQPDNAIYYIEKANYLTSTTYPVPEYNLAIQTISQAISIDPENAHYYAIRAKYNSDSDQLLASLSDYSKSIEMDPSIAEYYNKRGIIYLRIEDYLKAIEDFNSAIQIDPLNENYIISRGQARFNMTEYETAILDFTLSIDTIYRKISEVPGQINLDHPLNKALRRSYFLRGSALLQSESTFEACQDFEAAANLGESRATSYKRRYCR
ncbi:MAG: tetratricopeptide repeat protein [Saprospiraceae bacterium]|nr:tetratricopeptide repeat protein [Saprospiraceae bacterium]